MPREPSNPNSANFNGAWQKIEEWMGPQMPQNGNVVSSDGGAVANKGPKIALNRVDIAVLESMPRRIVLVPLAWNFADEIRERVLRAYDGNLTTVKYFPEVLVE